MKQLGVLLLPPSIAGLPPAVCRRYPFIHLGDERQCGTKFLVYVLLRKQHINEETNLASNHEPSDLLIVQSKLRRANHLTNMPPRPLVRVGYTL